MTAAQRRVQAASNDRRASIDEAKLHHSAELVRINRQWVDRVRPLFESKELTVDQVVEVAGINRQRVYQLFRLYPAADIDQETR